MYLNVSVFFLIKTTTDLFSSFSPPFILLFHKNVVCSGPFGLPILHSTFSFLFFSFCKKKQNTHNERIECNAIMRHEKCVWCLPSVSPPPQTIVKHTQTKQTKSVLNRAVREKKWNNQRQPNLNGKQNKKKSFWFDSCDKIMWHEHWTHELHSFWISFFVFVFIYLFFFFIFTLWHSKWSIWFTHVGLLLLLLPFIFGWLLRASIQFIQISS